MEIWFYISLYLYVLGVISGFVETRNLDGLDITFILTWPISYPVGIAIVMINRLRYPLG